MVVEDAQNVYGLCKKLAKYTNKYIGIFVHDKVCRTVFWLTTQYPQISINPEKWINFQLFFLEVDEIMEKVQ